MTDANLLLGFLGAESGLAGGVRLRPEEAERALAALGERLGLDALETAEGIVRVANQEMVRALRVVTVERGFDPRRFTLLPFGGAGPMHAAAIATELGIERILCPRAGGVLSAFGLTVTERRRDTARTVGLTGEALSREAIERAVAELAAQVRAGLAADARTEVVYELRYRGQAFELDVQAKAGAGPEELREGFEARHEERYGYRDPEGEIELVGIRVAAAEPAVDADLRDPRDGEPRRSTRRARFEGQWVEATVLGGTIASGLEVEGPAVVELPEATLVLPPGWSARVDERGSIVATRSGKAT